ncbi:hypothetical protein MMPV_003284 [Pyropia vietnamensis]
MRPPLPGLLYTIPPSLYISLTNAVNGTPLLATRGPGFPFATRFVPLPRGSAEPTAADVIAAVNSVSPGASGGGGSGGSGGGSGGGSISGSGGWDGSTVVFAGAGEPTLRPHVLLAAVAGLSGGYKTRLVTNGRVRRLPALGSGGGGVAPSTGRAQLATPSAVGTPSPSRGLLPGEVSLPQALRDAGLHSVSVALNAHDEATYARVMNLVPPATDSVAAATPAMDAVDGGDGGVVPGVPNTAPVATAASATDGSTATLADVLAFVADCAAVNLPGGVEVTCVEAPGVRVGAAQRLALEAGADAFRVRSWFGVLGTEEA